MVNMNNKWDLENWQIEACAHAAHEVNRAYCRSLGDNTQEPWDVAPDWQRASARDGVIFVANNPSVGPEASHENWSKQKVADGWKYGPIKDPSKKEHNCLVPFSDLPLEQQIKDSLFTNVVKVMLDTFWRRPNQ